MGERRRRREAERAAEGTAGGAGAAAEHPYRGTERRRPPAAPARIVPDRPERRRPRWILPLLALMVVAAVVAGTLAVLGRDDDTEPGAALPEPPGPERSLLVTVVDAGGDLTGTALLASGDAGTSALLVPSRLLVDVPSGGRVPLRDALDTGERAPAQAVADGLEVRVDGTWLLTSAGLAQLVDALGGVEVDVDAAVTADGVALAPGPNQRLDGVQAAAFASRLTAGEAESLRLARFDQVLAGVLVQLPRDPATVEQQVGALGEGSSSSLEPADLADVLAVVAQHVADDAYGATVLPVSEISTGAEEVLYGLDVEAAGPLLTGRFGGVRREGAGETSRVLVQNGVGAPGLGEQARNLLVDAGYRFVGGGNADALGRPVTVVAIGSDDAASREVGLGVAAALGLGPEVVAVGQDAPTLADVVVVLGADFAAVVGAGAP